VPDIPSLGDFEQLVLLALVRLGEDAYGVPIRQEIHTRAGRAVTLGSVYKTLDRLEAKGFVSSFVGQPTNERGGRRKKYFRLEPHGLRALRHSLAAIRRMTSGLGREVELP
jgi:PadR family transcriptional regulator PadR